MLIDFHAMMKDFQWIFMDLQSDRGFSRRLLQFAQGEELLGALVSPAAHELGPHGPRDGHQEALHDFQELLGLVDRQPGP